jgi:arylsulfatase A-like enzyme
LKIVVAAVFFWPGLSALCEKKPNIVYIIVDDMGWADTGCYGSKAVKTPHIDRMAARGMRFTNAYSGCTVCAPARSTLMTGQHMGHTSVRGNTGGIPLLDSDVTVAEVLKRAGYATGGFGKWGLGDINTEGAAEKQGFDTFFGYYHQVHAHNFYPAYLIKDGKHFPLPGNADLKDKKPKGPAVPVADPVTGAKRQFSAHLIFDEMKKFIRANRDNSFFCYAPWTPPHAAYHLPADEPAWALYRDKPWGNNAKVHAAFITMADRHVGETLALLKELGIENRTVVFFCSDNGASSRFEGTLNSSGPLTGFKRSMHEGGIRVPFIAYWPGAIKAGVVCDLPTYFPDFLPTAAAVAGAERYLPKTRDGLSILPTLRGRPEEQKRHEYLYWEWPKYNWRKNVYTGNMQAVRHGKWKLLRNNNRQPWQLYDLNVDIAEKNNLAARYPEIVKKLETWVTATRTDPRPQKEPQKARGKRYR